MMPDVPTFDAMEARRLCGDAIDWLEAHPEQHIGGEFIRARDTKARIYHVPEPDRDEEYCYCFLGRVAQEARNQHPEQCEGIEVGTLASAVVRPLFSTISSAYDVNDKSLWLERSPTIWKRLMIALGLRSSRHNAKTIAGLRETLAKRYADAALKELLS